MIDIQVDLARFQDEMGRLSAQAERAVQLALGDAGQSLFIASKRQLRALIYQKDIPKITRVRGPNAGRQVLAWRRKMNAGGLLGAETYVISSDGMAFTILTEPGSPAALYAQARHNLNRPSPIDGRTRAAPWRERAEAEGSDRAVDKFRARFRREMGL